MKLTHLIAVAMGLIIILTVDAQTISLDGEWEIAREATTNRVPEKWDKIIVPSSPDHPGPTVWYRRTFDVTKSQEPRRYVLRFGAVNFVCRILVNGQQAGEHLGGFVPFEVDITSQLRSGSNQLLVRVMNYQAVQGDFPVGVGLVPVTTGDKAFTAPSGTQGGRVWGICDHVRLKILPTVHVSDVFVKPSVRSKSVSARVTVRNADTRDFKGRLVARIMDGEKEVGRLPAMDVSIPAGKESVFESSPYSAENLTMWWPVTFRPAAVGNAKPKLYHMMVTLSDERSHAVHDERVRFGYRELWIDGTRFNLNGVPMILFGTGAHYGEGSLDPKKFYPLVLQTGARIVRLHGVPRMEEWYDVADELGVLVKDESAIFGSHQHFAVGEPVFWKNCEDHLRAWIRRDRNHPSVVIWSLSNEMGLDGLGKITDPEMQKLYRAMRAEDDTRPMEAEADGDISGISPIINIHCWWDYQKPMFPEDNYWLEKTPVKMGYRSFSNQSLRGKPLYIGEFSPDYTDNQDQGAIVAGDRVYDWDHDRRYGVYGEITRGRIEGYRWTGVAGIGPWTVFETGPIPSPYSEQHRLGYRPLAVFLRDVHEHFFGGQTYPLRAMVLNDSADRKDLLVRWELTMEGQAQPVRGEQRFNLDPAEHRRFEINVSVPQVSRRTPSRFTVELRDGDIVADRLDKTVWAFPSTRKESWPTGVKVFLYEPSGTRTAAALEKLGVPFARLTQKELSQIRTPGVLVIGANQPNAKRAQWLRAASQFVDAGGVVVCLEQNRAEWVPGLSYFDQGPHAINFVRSTGHPIWTMDWPIADPDLRWWQGGLAVTSEMMAKPTQGAFRILADGGIANKGTSLLEIPSGRGCWIVSQLGLVTRFNVEPLAGEILRRTLRYAVDRGESNKSLSTVGVYADGDLLTWLTERGASVRELSAISSESLAGCSAVLLHGPVFEPLLAKSPEPIIAALRQFAQNGGVVYLKDLSLASEILLSKLVPGIAWEPGWGHKALIMGRGDGMLSGLSGSDLRWCDDGPDTAVYNIEYLGRTAFKIPEAKPLTQPAFVQEVKLGKGRLVIDQIDWLRTRTSKARRVGETLLTNLGMSGTWQQGQVANPEDFFTVDLGPFVNRSLRDDTPNDGKGGWTDQGHNDLRVLPTGDQVFCGVPFHVVERDGGQAIMLAGRKFQQGLVREVKGIPVNRKAAGLVFLHGCAWSGGIVWRYGIHYADGTQVQVPVKYGVHVNNWWSDNTDDLAEAKAAWTGNNALHAVTLYAQEWVNPHPEKIITSLDIVSEVQAIPFVIAITGRTKLPPKTAARNITAGKVELSLPFNEVTSPVTFTAGPTTLTIDKDGNISSWKVAGELLVNRIDFGPRNSQWLFPTAPKLKTQWAELPNKSTLVTIRGEFAYLDVDTFMLIRPDGQVLMSMESVAKRDIMPEEFVVLRYYAYINSATTLGGTFNGVPLSSEYTRRVLTYGSWRWEGRIRLLGPKAGLDVEMTPSDYVLYDYRAAPSDPPPGNWDLTLEVPAKHLAGKKMNFQMKVSPVVGKNSSSRPIRIKIIRDFGGPGFAISQPELEVSRLHVSRDLQPSGWRQAQIYIPFQHSRDE